MATYNELLNSVTPARFKVGQVILSTASLMGGHLPCTVMLIVIKNQLIVQRLFLLL